MFLLEFRLMKPEFPNEQWPKFWFFDTGDEINPTQLYRDYFVSHYKDPIINRSVYSSPQKRHNMQTVLGRLYTFVIEKCVPVF